MLAVGQMPTDAEPALACAQVRELLHKRVRDTFLHPQFNTDVMKPLNIESLLDQEVLTPPIACSSALPAANWCSTGPRQHVCCKASLVKDHQSSSHVPGHVVHLNRSVCTAFLTCMTCDFLHPYTL